MGNLQELFVELRRRRVFRALVGWGIASFAILQIIEPVMHAYHLPEWTLTAAVTFLAAGFPVAVILSWIFDLSTRGIIRTAPAPAAGGGGATSPSRVVLLLLALGLLAAAPGLVYFFVWPGAAWRRSEVRPGGTSEAAPQVPSIAVLPFANLSSDKEQEYFSDGIAEEILNALAQVQGLKVIGRTSSFSMKGKSEDLRSIGQKLGAANLLEGSVRKAGPRVRITAQLVEAAGGTHLWSQEFDREMTDVFSVQEEIARAVVTALRLKLLPMASEPKRIIDPRAHDEYLLGLAYLAKGTAEAYGDAVGVLRQAVEIEPHYVLAWAALSSARFWHADQGGGPDGGAKEFAEAVEAAEKAVALGPDVGQAFRARALIRQAFLRDRAGAEADMERARALSPQNPDVIAMHATMLATVGRLPEAIVAFQQAAAFDPLSPDIPVMLSAVYLGTGRLEQAEAAARRSLEIAPSHGRGARNLGFALLLQGRLPEARAAFHRSSNPFFVEVGDAMVNQASGDPAQARKSLDVILARPSVVAGAYQVSEVYAWRGEIDKAFEWLKVAADHRDAGLVYVKYDPFLKPLRGDPRYDALLAKLQLPRG